jgi:hypothetical protein
MENETKNELITEGSALIAQFMGKTITPQVGTPEFARWKGEKCDYYFYEVRYHESWDWLIPVWIKFRDLEFTDQDEFETACEYCEHLISNLSNAKNASDFYPYVLDAIKWYLNYG